MRVVILFTLVKCLSELQVEDRVLFPLHEILIDLRAGNLEHLDPVNQVKHLVLLGLLHCTLIHDILVLDTCLGGACTHHIRVATLNRVVLRRSNHIYFLATG